MNIRKTLIGIFIVFAGWNLQAQDIAPQIWSNATLGKEFSEKFTLINTGSFNFLASKDFPWNEVSISSTLAYRFHKNFWAQGGLYGARVKQAEGLISWEVRPVAGFGVNSLNHKRFVISNLSRLEFRYLIYSDNKNEGAGRFRNLTLARVTLIKKHHFENKSLTLFGYVEFFANSKDIRERFVKQIKYKLGLAYRLTYNWRFNAGIIYQDANDNISYPVQLPTTIITNYIIEWGVVYFLEPN